MQEIQVSIFNSIMNKIFRRDASSAPEGDGSADAIQASSSQHASSSVASSGSSPASAGSTPTVDVEAVLSAMASKAGQQLDWRKSIVDLLKLLGLDSSMAARKELARELQYTGDTGDSAKMNVWLHKQVMQKLAENGGKVPESLKS